MRVPRLPRVSEDTAVVLLVIVGLPIAYLILDGQPVLETVIAGIWMATILVLLRR